MNHPELFNPFGTNLLKHKLHDEFFRLISEETEMVRLMLGDDEFVKQNSHAEYLAGKNSYQIRMDYEFIKKITLDSYLLSLGEYYVSSYEQKANLQLGSVWINYTYAGDVNPLHTHDALLSGVIYIKQDQSIYEEMKSFDGRNKHGMPGATHFVHKLDMHRFDNNSYTNVTEPGELLMFPSWLTHYVNSHHCEGERITIAFNILEK